MLSVTLKSCNGERVKRKIIARFDIMFLAKIDKKSNIEKPPKDATTVFRETAKGMGKLKLHSHEEYERRIGRKSRVNFKIGSEDILVEFWENV